MNDQASTKPVHVRRADARVNEAFGDTLHFHLTGAQNGGMFTMFTDFTPPGGGPPPHFHASEDEWWFVLEGQAEFFDGAAWVPVGAGGAVFMPRRARHTFRNAGTTALKQVIHTSPAGFEGFFQKCHDEFHKGGAPDVKRLLDIGREHGIHFYTLVPDGPADGDRPKLPPAIVQPGAGRVLRAFGEEVVILLDGAHTGGLVTSFLETTPPGGGPPPHWHEREDEWFYVLEGRVSFFVEGRWLDADPGDAVFAPRNSVHTFRNNTPASTRMLIHTSPSGFETFFAEAAEEFGRPGGPDMGRAMEIAGRHGIRFA